MKQLKNVLFPSNLSSESFSVFKKFIAGHGSSISEITILSKVLRPINAFAESSITAMGGSWIAPEQYLERENKHRDDLGKEWVSYAESQGVKAKVVVDDELGDVSDSVDKYAKENKQDMIVVGSFATATEAFFIGSIARQVVRQADIPVLVYHNKSN
ncbi:MAG: universal stress protein [Bdellovibrionales bacterium]